MLCVDSNLSFLSRILFAVSFYLVIKCENGENLNGFDRQRIKNHADAYIKKIPIFQKENNKRAWLHYTMIHINDGDVAAAKCKDKERL